ncbi:MAG: Gldg family protein [Alphaproteobacteria bacterium]|nr:Gldg family protein [Alphaproteobacteria bacterium]
MAAALNTTALTRRRNSVIALGLAAILFVAMNLLAQALLTGARIDLTRDKLFTLSPGTRAILGRIDEPVTLRYFFSDRLGREIPAYANYGKRVEDMLAEFAANARGRLVVERFDPQPFSDIEDRAVALGLQGVPIDQGGDPVYFGISGTNSTDDKETIGFLQPERERFLEYDLARMVQTLADPKRKMIGLITDLPLEGDMMMMMRGMPTQPWMVMEQLRGAFDIKTLGGDLDRVPEDVDVLMLAHPKSLSDKTQYAIDQFVLKGGRALVLVDPYAESEIGRPNMMGRPGTASASDLPRLFQAWGVEMTKDKVAGDRANARRVNAGTASRVIPAEYPAWLLMRAANINRDDPIMSNIGQVNMASAGILKKRDGATTTFEPLITTSAQSAPIEVAQLGTGPGGQPDILSIVRSFKPTMEGMVLAARVSGEASSAFPDGPPKPPEPKEGEAKPAESKESGQKDAKPLPPHVAKSQKPINVIVVADTDLLDDRFWVQVQDFFGQRLAVPTANNADFVANALDFLAGGGDLIGLRGRGTSARPFTVVRALEQDAEARLRGTERELRDKLTEVQKNLRDVETGDRTGGQPTLTPQQQQSIEKFRAEMLDIRRQLRDVQHGLRRDVERLETVLRFVNIGLVPILVAVLALIVGGVRLARRRRRVARA